MGLLSGFGKSFYCRCRCVHVLIGVLLPFVVLIQTVAAAPTPPGTVITNQASITYDTDLTTDNTQDSNTTTTVVQEVIDVDVTWQDSSAVAVIAGEENAVLTFLVTNTGNGVESFALSVDSSLTGDDFDPVPDNIYLDNGDGILNTATDPLYVPGTNDPVLDPANPATQSIVVFVLNDIPGSVVADDTGDSALTATAATGGGSPPGTLLTGQGDGGTAALVGLSGGQDTDIGTYEVKPFGVNTLKSVTVTHPDYPDLEYAVPGSVLTYTITVTVFGESTATDVVVTDPIPNGTTYNAGSLKLNTTALTDAADGDAGDVGATTANTVTVALPDMTSTTPTQTIEFSVTVDEPPATP